MTDRHVLRLDEGGEIEVLPDIRGGKPVVVLFTKCVYVTDGERLEIAGVVLNLTERMEYTVRTNVLLDEEAAGTLMAMLKRAFLDDEGSGG